MTAERFITDAQGQRLYKSGDIARWNLPVNCSTWPQRPQVKLRGFRIELTEIESQLRPPAISDAAVVVQDLGNDQRLVVLSSITRGEEPTASQLRTTCARACPITCCPSSSPRWAFPHYALRQTRPQTTGRPEQVSSGGGQAYTAPTTATEKLLVEIWAGALLKEQVSIDSQFFDIGGHSLLALVILAIEEACQVRFAPQDMWVNTLEQLAAKIDAGKKMVMPASLSSPHPVTRAALSKKNAQAGWAACLAATKVSVLLLNIWLWCLAYGT